MANLSPDGCARVGTGCAWQLKKKLKDKAEEKKAKVMGKKATPTATSSTASATPVHTAPNPESKDLDA